MLILVTRPVACVLLAFLVFAGCASMPPPLIQKSYIPYDHRLREATLEQAIEILDHTEIQRPFKVIGEVRVTAGDPEQAKAIANMAPIAIMSGGIFAPLLGDSYGSELRRAQGLDVTDEMLVDEIRDQARMAGGNAIINLEKIDRKSWVAKILIWQNDSQQTPAGLHP